MHSRILLLSGALAAGPLAFGQASHDISGSRTPVAATAPTVVPALVLYADVALSGEGKPLTGEMTATFLLFTSESGGDPLWMESQRVTMDAAGHYRVQLGSSSPNGLPLEVFSTGEARWLEVQIAGQTPQARVLLSSVPYAAKAADAATLGGLPASAFMRVGAAVNAAPAVAATGAAAGATPDTTSTVTTTGGTSKRLPVFSGANTVVDSEIYDTGTSVGVGGTPSSTVKLDVLGGAIFRGSTSLYKSGVATSTKGYPSYALNFLSDVYSSSTKATLIPDFSIQSEAAGNNTAAPSSTLNFLYASSGTPKETGLYLNSNGTFHFSPSQTFPGTGTVTSVGFSAPVTDFNVIRSTSPTAIGIELEWNAPPTPADQSSAIIKRDANGGFQAGAITAKSLVTSGSASANTLTVYGTSYLAGANLAGPVGIGTNTPAALLNLNKNNLHNSDFLLIGNNSTKGLQLRDNGTGVDMESFGVPLNINYLTKEPTIINPNGGVVTINDTHPAALDPTSSEYFALTVGTVAEGGGARSGHFEGYSQFDSDVDIAGDLEVGGSINGLVAHPLDPAHKYLAHAAIESSEVLNQYSGNITTDELGLATVHLPDWFGAENTDFRYQLTVIGGRFAQAIVSKEIENNEFMITTNASHIKVSWQVTAKRNDPYMKAHPFVAEREKPADKRGHYEHPEWYGHPELAGTNGKPSTEPVTRTP